MLTLAAITFGVWLAFNIPPGAPQCWITGWVHASEVLREVEVRLGIPKHCSLIKAEMRGRMMILQSRRWFVEVEVPTEGGWTWFQYRWGASKAMFGIEDVYVMYGPVGGV